MNRHRAYWSKMHDENTEPSSKSKDLTSLHQTLVTLLNMYDETEVLTQVRIAVEEVRNDKKNT